MNTRTIAASVLALGFLASGAFAQGSMEPNNYRCPTDQRDRANYTDCVDASASSVTNAFGAADIDTGPKRAVGDFIDETPAESNQRSSN